MPIKRPSMERPLTQPILKPNVKNPTRSQPVVNMKAGGKTPKKRKKGKR